MNRTYNTFVDNGLFVLAYYLNKSVEDLTEKDIVDNINMMSEKLEDFFSCEKYSNLRSMTCQNSYMTQKPKKGTRAEAFADKLKGYIKGTDCCEVCGEYKANPRNDLSRCYFPTKTANTFYNFSNNLQGVNICPNCIRLAMYSLLNCRVGSDSVILYNSDNDDFMVAYTKNIQHENQSDIVGQAKKDTKNKLSKTYILENLLYNKKSFKRKSKSYYVDIYNFNNNTKNESINIVSIDNDNVTLLEKIYDNDLEQEFKSLWLMNDLINNKLSSTYLFKIYNFEKEELKCSRELFDFLNKEVNRLDNKVIEIIKNITTKITFDKKTRNELKLINNSNDFNDFLVKIAEEYGEKYNDKLFTVEEYCYLSNRLKFKEIKNLLLISTI